ncbi:MAG: hypothetical protein K2Q14_04810 [Gammaproteobacteria bacterium]|nr:hypothetical protein [Gammaproteobacteria bacterium]MBY0544853.1 hypothetical protein [Gammaproteobacteria bacterium]
MKQTIWISVTSIIVALILVLGGSYIAGKITASDGNAKQADFIETQVAQKIVWMQNINTAINEVRNVNLQIRQQCANAHSPSVLQQNILRSQARLKFLAASSGVGIIFDDNTLTDTRAFFQYDKSVNDVCAGSATDDKAWWEYAVKINQDFNASIAADRNEIARLHGVTAS